MLLERATRQLRWCEPLLAVTAVVLSAVAFGYDVSYTHLVAVLPRWVTGALGFLGLMTWRYFLFFYFGMVVRRHFSAFERLLDSRVFIALMAATFVTMAWLRHSESVIVLYVVFAAGGISGATLLFALFRRFSVVFSHATTTGRVLMYIGRRTLDVYLLHYFLLPRFLMDYSGRALIRGNLVVEIAAVAIVSMVVTALTLAVSHAIRKSDVLAYWLFGAKTYGGSSVENNLPRRK